MANAPAKTPANFPTALKNASMLNESVEYSPYVSTDLHKQRTTQSVKQTTQ